MKRNDFKQTLEMCSIRKALGVFYCICCTENMFLFSPLDFRCQPHSREEFLRKTKARPRVSNRWPCAAKSSLVKSYSFPSRIVSLKALKIKQHFFFFPSCQNLVLTWLKKYWENPSIGYIQSETWWGTITKVYG